MSVLRATLNEVDSAAVFWLIFIEWWPEFEFPHTWENLAERLRNLHATDPAHNFMSRADQAFFNTLPERILVYRGGSSNFPLGISWTTDEEKALWFARRFDELKASVASGTLCKRDVWAVFTERSESEILCDPLAVQTLSREPVASGRRPKPKPH